MKKLFKVTLLYYCMAEDALDAEVVLSDVGDNCTCTVVETKSVNPDWWDAIPFGSNDDRTCGKILKAGGS